jgi:CRISPR-associated protein Csm4
MKTYQITLALPSGFVTPWHADTIFGHLCWTAERHDCFQRFSGAAGLIELFRRDEPPFILSDGFPSGLLPAPVTLKSLFGRAEACEIDVDQYDLMKRAKKAEYITIEEFLMFQNGSVPALSGAGQKGFTKATVLHNTISRITNTTGSQGSLFESDEIFAANGEIQIYVKIRDGFEEDVRLLFDRFAQGSYGAKKSTGKGTFSIKSFLPCSGFDGSESKKPGDQAISGFVSLSHFVPAKGGPTEGAYKTMIKYGKLGEEKTFCGQPFKKPLIMLKPGAVFYTDNIRPYYGLLMENISDAEPSVVQYAFAFSVPFVMAQNRQCLGDCKN